MRRLDLVLSATSDFHRGHEQGLQLALKRGDVVYQGRFETGGLSRC
jgi:hypothetical protein